MIKFLIHVRHCPKMETAFDLMSFTSASSSFPCLNFCRDLELVPINSFDGDNVFIHYYEKFTCLVLFMLKFFFLC